MNDTSKVALALLAGLAAGAALGVLFAPDKGSDTRDKINDSLSDLSDAIRERAEEQFDQLNDFKEKIVSTLKGKLNQTEEVLDDDIIEHAQFADYSYGQLLQNTYHQAISRIDFTITPFFQDRGLKLPALSRTGFVL